MSDDVAVVWVDGGGDEQATRALADWARARGVRLRGVDGGRAMTVDHDVAERVEEEIERAREAIAATDADTAERALARVEAWLREHPELPQAAWLRAEAERTWSARWLHVEPRDAARAKAAWENARALDGGRAAGVGETDVPGRPTTRATIVVSGARSPRLRVRLDGTTLEPRRHDGGDAVYEIDVAPAEHHLTASVDERLLFASWVAIAATPGGPPPPIQVHVDGDHCSRDGFTDVKRDGSRVIAEGVDCADWVAALRAPPAPAGTNRSSVLVARCKLDACGPLLEWRVERLGPSSPPQQPPPRSGWPAWATWTILGVGAAAATSVAVIASGVLEPRPVEHRFVVGGVRQE